MTRILLIGATGQLGSELARLLAGPALTAVAHEDLEITDTAATAAGQCSTATLDERGEPASPR